MSVHQELLTYGEFGPIAIEVLTGLMGQELRKQSWVELELDDAVQSFFLDKGKALTAQLLATATDDESVGRILRRSVQRWLIDQARKTASGARFRRLADALSREGELFAQVPDGQPGAGRWFLRGGPTAPTAEAFGELVAAAWAVTDVTIPPWNSADRRAPFADHQSLIQVLQAVLDRANGSVTVALLVSVCRERFPIGLDPAIRPVDDLDRVAPERATTSSGRADPTATAVAQAETEQELTLRARRVLQELTPTELRLLPVLGESLERRRDVLGLGSSQVHHHTRAMKQRFAMLVGVAPEATTAAARDELMLKILDLCARPPDRDDPDDPADATSDSDARRPSDQGGVDLGAR